ncbi:MAG: hypothetical protein K6E28_05580 [Eubacterium sp.]|nr:hypothetical protein [Eubacterium sp.]
MNNLMDLRLLEYDSEIDKYVQLESIVVPILEEKLRQAEITPMQIAHRIKTKESVAEKLERKPNKYPTVTKMMDLLGVRIICYFSNQVDQIAEIIRSILKIDEKNSIDKRKTLEPNTFGYLSLHYICSIPNGEGYPEELTRLKFEIQIRTVLQHTWAEIEHDLGYKTEFGIPKELRRNFSRVAGLLEIADEAFLQIRQSFQEYELDVRERIANDTADDMHLDLVTLRAYLELSKTMQGLLAEIAAITNSIVVETSPESYILNLEFFGVHTLGEMNEFVREGYDNAVFLARKALANVELDEVSSVAGLHYLCRAHLVNGDYDEMQLMNYYMLGEGTENRAKQQTKNILRIRRDIRK